VLLTSHYMADVEALCKRVVVIHHGRLLFDGDLAALVRRFAPHKTVSVELAARADGSARARALHALGGLAVDLADSGDTEAAGTTGDAERIILHVPQEQTAEAIARLAAAVPIADVSVTDPPIDDVIAHLFASADAESSVPLAAEGTREGAHGLGKHAHEHDRDG
jgi:ABC-2 type transport system ATP-binding protein